MGNPVSNQHRGHQVGHNDCDIDRMKVHITSGAVPGTARTRRTLTMCYIQQIPQVSN